MIKVLLKFFGLAIFFSVSCMLLLILFFWVYLVVNSTGILVSYDNYLFQKKIREHLLLGAHEVSVKELATFEWDAICIYPPYCDKFYDSSGNILNEIEGSVSTDDNIYNVQFMSHGRQVAVLQIKRWTLSNSFLNDLKSDCFTDKARFVFNDQGLTTIME